MTIEIADKVEVGHAGKREEMSDAQEATATKADSPTPPSATERSPDQKAGIVEIISEATENGEMVAKRPAQLKAEASGRFEWIIHLAGARPPVGWVSLRIADRDPNSGEIGYSILREHRGQGVATEAVRTLVREAFHAATLRKLRAYCVPDNVPSRRVLDSIGFSYEGLLPHGATVNGRPVDVLSHVLDRENAGPSGNSIEIPASA